MAPKHNQIPELVNVELFVLLCFVLFYASARIPLGIELSFSRELGKHSYLMESGGERGLIGDLETGKVVLHCLEVLSEVTNALEETRDNLEH